MTITVRAHNRFSVAVPMSGLMLWRGAWLKSCVIACTENEQSGARAYCGRTDCPGSVDGRPDRPTYVNEMRSHYSLPVVRLRCFPLEIKRMLDQSEYVDEVWKHCTLAGGFGVTGASRLQISSD